MIYTPWRQDVVFLLTFSRLLLIIPLVKAFVMQHWWGVMAIALLSLITDSADGALARRWNVCSTAGAIIDPVVDKFFTAVFFIGLFWARVVPWWFFQYTLLRELISLVLVFVALLSRGSRVIKARWWGKLAGTIQTAWFMALVLCKALPFNLAPEVWQAGFVLVALFNAWSLVFYVRHFNESERS
jgi:CDP-diacylglycerol--glycerol-3-phosphate 3-phosphatidyltransferase